MYRMNNSTHTHTIKICTVYGDLLECLTSCGSVIPKLGVYEWKVKQSSSCSAHKPGCLIWSLVFPKEISPNASEEFATR